MEKKHSFAVLAFVRRNKYNSPTESSVYLRLTIDGQRTEISTKTTVVTERWQPGRGRVKGNGIEAVRINDGIIAFEHRAREIYNQFIEQGKIININSIKNELLGISHRQNMLIEFFQEVLDQMENRLNHGYAIGTIKNWKVTLRHLKEFLEKYYRLNDIAFKELKLKFIIDFEWYARNTWSCGNNAALKHIERIRKVVKKAVINDWLARDPFLGFQGSHEKSRRTYLNKAELDAIENKNFYIPRLQKVADVFIFCCYTGLAHIDVENLTNNNLVVGIGGKRWIYTFRQKTDSKSNIPLLPKALSIIEKYYNNKNPNIGSKLLPVISNIKTNAYLKEIADLCGINKNLTFHMARHTFATTITLTNGVPIETVSNMLGHTKITTTQIYAKVLENKVSEDMKILESKLLSRVKI